MYRGCGSSQHGFSRVSIFPALQASQAKIILTLWISDSGNQSTAHTMCFPGHLWRRFGSSRQLCVWSFDSTSPARIDAVSSSWLSRVVSLKETKWLTRAVRLSRLVVVIWIRRTGRISGLYILFDSITRRRKRCIPSLYILGRWERGMGRSFGIYQVIRIARHISIIQSIKHLILLLDARLIRMIG